MKIVNQHRSKMCMVVEKKQEKKSEENIIENIKNLFRLKKENEAS